MKFRTIGSKLAARLRLVKQHEDNNAQLAYYPNLDDIFSKIQSSGSPALMRVPQEIRNLIFEILWNDVGVAQHIFLQSGCYTSSKCVTNHSAPDELMNECTKRRTNRFQDEALWLQITSAWGNHWKCEEFHQHGRPKDTQKDTWSPFLSMMLVCKQMYIECRASIYSTVTFVIHDIDTLYNLTVRRPLPIINDIKYLNLAIRLPIRRESKKKMSPESKAIMSRWHDCCRALDQVPGLAAVDLWLDTTEPVWRGVLSSVPEGKANPFIFGSRLAGILTVDLPVNPERSEAWRQVASVEPKFSIRARGWPAFRAEMEATTLAANSIIKLWDSAEPGAVQPPVVFGTHYGHPSSR